MKPNDITPIGKTSPKRGRPAIYSSAAERARAWRSRQKELLAQTTQTIVERVVEINTETPQKRGKHATPVPLVPQANKLIQSFDNSFQDIIGGEEKAKRLRILCATAANNVRTILSILNSTPSPTLSSPQPSPQTELDYLLESANFLDELHQFFESKQHQAKRIKETARTTAAAAYKVKLQSIRMELFGHISAGSTNLSMELHPAIQMAQHLLVFASKEIRNADALLRGLDHSDFSLEDSNALRRAIEKQDVEKISLLIAETKLSLGEKGHYWSYQNKSGYANGWEDFINWVRTNKD